jgi:hypothetical protein
LMDDRPRAFVLMPFAKEFDRHFTRLITPALEAAGYAVSRADTVLHNENIIKTIVRQINAADLVVADLTAQNANVFYEVGIAHALRRPVLLITQSMEDVPFDLRSYPVIEYGIDYDLAEDFKEKLRQKAEGIRLGRLPCTGPVDEFIPTPPESASPVSATEPSPVEQEDDRGWLDFTVSLQDSVEASTMHLTEMTQAAEDMTRRLQERGEAVERAQGQADATRAVHAIGLLTGRDMEQYCERVEPLISRLESEADAFEEASQALSRLMPVNSAEQRAQLAQLRPVAEESLEAARTTLRALEGYRVAIRELQEMRISQAITRGARAVLRIVDRQTAVMKVFESAYAKTIATIDDRLAG